MSIHLLTVAINDYPGTQNDLSCCIADAELWTEVIGSRVNSHVKLYNKAATRRNILNELKNVVGKLGGGDWGVIIYSGHGTWEADLDGDEPDGKDEAIVPYDFQNGVLLDDDISPVFTKRINDSNLLIITDSCHSGTVYRAIKKSRYLPPAKRFADVKKAKKAENKPSTPVIKIGPGIVHLAACQDTEYAYEADGNGAFTIAAVTALRKLRTPTFYNWIASIKRRLPTEDYPQTPVLNALPFIKKAVIPWMW